MLLSVIRLHTVWVFLKEEKASAFRGNGKFDGASDLSAAWLVSMSAWARAPPGLPTTVPPRLHPSGSLPAPHAGEREMRNFIYI